MRRTLQSIHRKSITPFRFDRSIKQLVEGNALMLAESFLGLKGKAEIIRLDGELPQILHRDADCVLKHTNDSGKVTYLHFEFQSDYDDEMPYRLLLYFVLIRLKFKQKPKQLLVHLGKRKNDYSTEIEEEDLKFKYSVIYVQEQPLELFLKAGTPESTVLGILADYPNKDEKVKRIVERLMDFNLPANRVSDYLAICEILSELNDLSEVINQIRSDMALNLDITRSSFYQKGEQRGIEKGRRVGIEEGIEKGVFSVALNLYEAKVSLEQIKEFTKMSDELWQQFLEVITKRRPR